MIKENIAKVQERINAACERSGRKPADITLCAVSKLKPVDDIREAMAAGQYVFGENYVQELKEKMDELGAAANEPRTASDNAPANPSDGAAKADAAGNGAAETNNNDGLSRTPEWHMIGHLQRNKVKYIVDRVAMIHSVDSVRLAEQIEKEAAKCGRVVDILLEVNMAAEESKWGFTPDEAKEAAKLISGYEHVNVKGIMTSAPYTENPESNRVYFRQMRLLLDDMRAEGILSDDANVLSMGMSGDFEVAVEEGATIVRVGTSIFGERNYDKQ